MWTKLDAVNLHASDSSEDDEDDSFEAIVDKNKGKYKKWLQKDYLESLPASCKGGACYALSVIYIYLNHMHSLAIDSNIPDEVKRSAIAENGLRYSVELAMTTAMAAQISPTQGQPQQATTKRHSLKFREVLGTTEGRQTIGAIQEAENKRKDSKEERTGYESDLDRIRDFNIGWLQKLTNGQLKPASEHVPQVDLDDVKGNELSAVLDQLCSPGFHILDVPGHTQAVVVRKGKFKYFDPDEGQAVFTAEEDFDDFINEYLTTHYRGLVSVYPFQ
ncbi:MAG TPA: hypothetical protein VMA71_03730 [Alloacidobacterium sp.]|nr:hypothetical protein [Alloacidobacterium sp.]